MSKPVFIALSSDNNILGTFLAASPALSFAAQYLSGDTNATLTVEHGDASYHALSPRKLKALSEGQSQGGSRAFKVMVADDSEELVKARVALSNAIAAIAALPAPLPEPIAEGMLAPLRDAVTSLESADEGDALFVTLLASQPMRRAYGTVDTPDAPEATEEPEAEEPETAGDRAAAFKASVGLK